MMTGGAAWFTDLTVPDPTFVLPALGAGLMLATVELNANEMGTSDANGTMKNLMRLMSLAFLGMGAYFPSVWRAFPDTCFVEKASFLFPYILAMAFQAIGKNLLLRAPGFRRLTGLPELVSRPTASAHTESISDMYKRIAQNVSGSESENHLSSEGMVKTYSVKTKRRRN
eukprot:scaffold39771_cov53-Prasinocladus_malaysianus.AAC.2